MSKLIVMIGISGSGKSYHAEKMANLYDATIVSSDDKREEWYGDAKDQDHNTELFQRIHHLIGELLDNDTNVVYDATNTSAKRRAQLFEMFKPHSLIACFVSVTFDTAMSRMALRERKVPEDIVRRQYHGLDVPLYGEGWKGVHYVDNAIPPHNTSIFENREISCPSILRKEVHDGKWHNYSYEHLSMCSLLPEVAKCIDFPQDSSYHTLSVSRHMLEAYREGWRWCQDEGKYWTEYDKMCLQWSLVLHDLGKPFVKKFKPNAKYANFLMHEKVSAQLAVIVLLRLGFTTEQTLRISTMVNMHMRVHNADSNKAKNKIIKLVGSEHLFDLLVVHGNCDHSAK